MPDTNSTAPKDFRPSNTSGPTHVRTPHGNRTKNTFEMCDPPPNGGRNRQSSQEHYAVKRTLKLVIICYYVLKIFNFFFNFLMFFLYFKLIISIFQKKLMLFYSYFF